MRYDSPEAAADRHDDPAGRRCAGSSGDRYRLDLADRSRDDAAVGGIGSGRGVGSLSPVRQMAGLEYRCTLPCLRNRDFLGLTIRFAPQGQDSPDNQENKEAEEAARTG